jgi:DNA mismatch repair ATPase MutL
MNSGTQQSQPLLGNQNNQPTNQNKQLTNQNKQLTNRNKQPTNQNKQLTNQNKNKQPTNQNKQLTNRNKQPTNQNKQLTNQNKNKQPTKTGGNWKCNPLIILFFVVCGLLAIILPIVFVKKNKNSTIIEYQKPLLKNFGEYSVIMKNNKIDQTIEVDRAFESPSKEYNVKFQSDGNIVVYHSTKSPVATGTQWFVLSPPPIYTFTSKGQIIITGKSDKNDLKIDKKIYNIGDDITYTIRSSGNTLVIDNNGNVFVMNT